MSDSNFWGSLIVQLRTEQGLSQRQLAAGAKVNRSTLRLIEEGKSPGYIDSIEALLQYMGHELDVVSAEVSLKLKAREHETEDPKLLSRIAYARLLSLKSTLAT